MIGCVVCVGSVHSASVCTTIFAGAVSFCMLGDVVDVLSGAGIAQKFFFSARFSGDTRCGPQAGTGTGRSEVSSGSLMSGSFCSGFHLPLALTTQHCYWTLEPRHRISAPGGLGLAMYYYGDCTHMGAVDIGRT